MRKDKFIRVAEERVSSGAISGFNEEKLNRIVAMADAVVPPLEPYEYDADVTEYGQYVIWFDVDSMTIGERNRRGFQDLIKEAVVVRIRKEDKKSDIIRVRLYFDIS